MPTETCGGSRKSLINGDSILLAEIRFQEEPVMAIGKCMECGQGVSEHAHVCPTCGAPLTFARRHPWRAIGALLVVGFVAIIGIFAMAENRISRLPPMPVQVNYRPSLLGARAGFVVVIENTSDQALPLMATLRHSAVNAGKSFDIYVPARSQMDIGRLNSGWTAERGDQIALQNSNYQPWRGSIP
jgi:hypothetical protein